ncbi:hypothetical protein ES319_D12G076200v1 [Gossypium barbadense]|uniref:Uncharacterized protein n=2 Tax=Gossypium TaxID=3633 RepID=A0A5J5NW57_GOSBA|nr:hypothetical protein ES319_D12G076200v1 [Gossypium barbadense]TYG40268.1 hypothetical protein ES288_D12G079800v1 [Gossypium darwinii]
MSQPTSFSLDQPYTEIIVGHMDVELNEVGRQQAASLAERLSRVPEISAIYSSDLKRALETAETIVATCGKFEVIKDPDLRERHLGDVQGLLFRDSQSLSPGLPSIFVSPDRSSYTWRWRKLRPTLSSCYIFITENLSETYREASGCGHSWRCHTCAIQEGLLEEVSGKYTKYLSEHNSDIW